MSTFDTKKPIILVVGATGAQGGSVVRHLARTGKYIIRGMTRNTESEAAKRLLALENVELVKGDLSNPESLKAAVQGIEGAFLNTTQDAFKKSDQQEIQEGKNLVDAIQLYAPGFKHLVFSSLPNWDKEGHNSDGPKLHIENYIKEKGIPYSITYAMFYFENWIEFFAPSSSWSGKLYFWCIPTGGKDFALPYVCIEDYGAIVADVFNRGPGQVEIAVSQMISFKEALASISKAIGQEIAFEPMDQETYRYIPLPSVAVDIISKTGEYPKWNPILMSKLPDAMAHCHKIYPDFQVFDKWCIDHADQLKKARGFLPPAFKKFAHVAKTVRENICVFVIVGLGITACKLGAFDGLFSPC